MMRNACGVTTFMLCALAGAAHGASFQGLGDLPGGTVESSAAGVSADGLVVVGSSSSGNGDEAFRWDAVNGMVGIETGDGLDILDGLSYFTSAAAVSANGAVITGTIENASMTLGFRWDAVSGMHVIWPFPGEDYDCRPQAISSDGTIIVGWSSAGGNEGESFRWTEATGITPLENNPESASFSADAISGDGLVIAGQGQVASDVSSYRAFQWDAVAGAVALDPTPQGHFFSAATDANVDGSVLVGYMEVNVAQFTNRNRAFRWTLTDGFVNLGTFGNTISSTLARAVNSDGTVIVGERSDATSEAFIWRDGIGLQRLATVLTNEYGLDLTGWTLSSATGVSGDGTVIVGSGTNPSGQPEAWIAVLSAPPPACAGDVTGDDKTTVADFNVVASHFGQAVAPGADGDLNGDGFVSVADFNILAGDFACGLAP